MGGGGLNFWIGLFHLLNLPIDKTREVFGCGGRCGGAGNLRDDIFEYKHQVDSCTSIDDERRSFLLDMGINALRLVLFPLTPKDSAVQVMVKLLYVYFDSGRTLSMWTCLSAGICSCFLQVPAQ